MDLSGGVDSHVVDQNGVGLKLDGDLVLAEVEPGLVVLLIPVGGAVVGLGHQTQGYQVGPAGGGDAGGVQLLAVEGDGGGVAVHLGGDEHGGLSGQGGNSQGAGQGQGQGGGTEFLHRGVLLASLLSQG